MALCVSANFRYRLRFNDEEWALINFQSPNPAGMPLFSVTSLKVYEAVLISRKGSKLMKKCTGYAN